MGNNSHYSNNRQLPGAIVIATRIIQLYMVQDGDIPHCTCVVVSKLLIACVHEAMHACSLQSLYMSLSKYLSVCLIITSEMHDIVGASLSESITIDRGTYVHVR